MRRNVRRFTTFKGKRLEKKQLSKRDGEKTSLRRRTLASFIASVLVIVLIALFFSERGQNITSIVSGLFRRDIELKTSSSSYINILFLGIGGGGHAGPNLTDTIVFAHIDRQKNNIQLISIPRDLWIPVTQAKINSSYAYGQKEGRKGILLASSVVEKVVGQVIDYTVVVDFQGFVKLVDLLSGIEVDVQKSFSDNYYPIPGREDDLCGRSEEETAEILATASSELSQFEIFPCRYQQINFERGKQVMDGETALLFVRSRHAQGDEGTDFARSRRQIQVLLAVKDKILSLGTLVNPVKVFGMIDVLEGHVTSDISTFEYDDFIKLAQKMQNAKISHYVIDTGNEKEERFGLLVNPPISDEYRMQWVLIPRKGNGDFSEIQEYVKCIVNNQVCEIGENGVSVSNAR